MRSGLTLTIPSGWVGVLKSSASDDGSVVGVLGRPGATQSLRLRRTSGAGAPMHISLSSARESEASASGLKRVGQAGDVTLYCTRDRVSSVPTLLIAETHLPGSQYGAVLFRGEAGEAEAAVGEIWRLLQIEDAPLSGTSTVVYRW